MDFGFESNVPYDAGSYGFHSRSLEDTDKYIEVADVHHVTVKQKGSARIQMCNDNGKTFVATLYNVILALDICDRISLVPGVLYIRPR